MNACYRWLPGGPTLHAHHEDHARGKVLEVYPDAVFERQDEPGQHVTRAWMSLTSRQQGDEPIAEICWSD